MKKQKYEVEETWNNMKFTVYSYMKGTSNRGFILGSIDEVLQILDDSAMNKRPIHIILTLLKF
jgi:dynein heavy chain